MTTTCQSCNSEIASASHCSNINRSILPFGVLTLDSYKAEIEATAKVIAQCVRGTMEAFPNESRSYEKGLIAQAVACAVADDDFIDVAPELEKAVFFAIHPRN